MNANLALNRVWPLLLMLAAIALAMHVSSASGAERTARTAAKPEIPPCNLRTWCDGCCERFASPCDDYCPKPAPCVRRPSGCRHCADYEAKCAPHAPCRDAVGCADDYRPKPCPTCPTASCSKTATRRGDPREWLFCR